MNTFYRIWCFFMDSEKGRRQYYQDCSDYNKKKNGVIFTTFITFAPYPGRLNWRKWWIIKQYRNLIWRLNYKKLHPEISLNIKHVTCNMFKNDCSEFKPMEMSGDAIYYVSHVMEEK